jgi:hemolysin activation/secretion protein
MGANFQLRNLFGMGDSSRLHLQLSPKAELATGTLSTRIPLGGGGWGVDVSLSRLSYLLGAPYDALIAYGDANSVHGGLSYQLIRGVDQNVTVSGGWDYKNLTDRSINPTAPNNQKNSQQIGLGVLASTRDDWAGGGTLQSSMNLSVGRLDWVTANVNQGAEGSFTKFNFDINRRQFLTTDWTAIARWQGQTALDNLDSSEKFSLTGPYAVRAYAPGLSSVDTGAVLSLELRKAYALQGGTLYGSVFYDYAQGYIDMKPVAGTDNNAVLRGHGLGLGWNTGGDWDASATLAWRATPLVSTSADRTPYLYFQLTKGF